MSSTMQLPVIAGVEITTDDDGRYNLNALHKASGGGDASRRRMVIGEFYQSSRHSDVN